MARKCEKNDVARRPDKLENASAVIQLAFTTSLCCGVSFFLCRFIRHRFCSLWHAFVRGAVKASEDFNTVTYSTDSRFGDEIYSIVLKSTYMHSSVASRSFDNCAKAV